MSDHYVTAWELFELLALLGGPVYLLAVCLTYGYLRRKGRAPTGHRWRVVLALLIATMLALPIQLVLWWALGQVPLVLLNQAGGHLSSLVLMLPAVFASLICFPVAARLLGRSVVRQT